MGDSTKSDSFLLDQEASIPALGSTFRALVGEYTFDPDSIASLSQISLPTSYRPLLERFYYAAPADSQPLVTPYTRQIFYASYNYSSSTAQVRLQTRTKYKPVHKKVRPVPTYMPDPAGQTFKPIVLSKLPPLPLDPPSRVDFVPTSRLSQDRLDLILSSISAGFLLPREIDLFVFILWARQSAIAFTDSERGTFSPEYYPDYEIPVIEHIPWVQDPIRIPQANLY